MSIESSMNSSNEPSSRAYWDKVDIEYGGGFSLDTTGLEGHVVGGVGGVTKLPAAEISSSPSMRILNLLTLSSNFFASHIVHLAIVRHDFCFWLSRILCRNLVTARLLDSGTSDTLGWSLSSSRVDEGTEGRRYSYFCRIVSTSVRMLMIVATHWVVVHSRAAVAKVEGRWSASRSSPFDSPQIFIRRQIIESSLHRNSNCDEKDILSLEVKNECS